MGEYEGMFVKFEFGYLEMVEHDGKKNSWPVTSAKVARKIEKLGLEPGYKITVEVEFNDYTVVNVTLTDLEPKAMLRRIEALEAQIAALYDGYLRSACTG